MSCSLIGESVNQSQTQALCASMSVSYILLLSIHLLLLLLITVLSSKTEVTMNDVSYVMFAHSNSAGEKSCTYVLIKIMWLSSQLICYM